MQMLRDTPSTAKPFVVCVVALIAFAASTAPAQLGFAPLPTDEPITYYIADGDAAAAYRPTDRELAVWALEAWRSAAGNVFELAPASEDQAILRIYFVGASGGQYGEMRPVIVNGRRGAEVYVRPDVDALGPDIARAARRDALLRETIVYLTCLHELGHAFGLSHTAEFADVMYFFGYGGDIPGFFGRYREQLGGRGDIATVSGLSDRDVARVEALYSRADERR